MNPKTKQSLRAVLAFAGVVGALWLILPALYTHVPRARIDGTRLLPPLELLATQVAEARQDRGLDGLAAAVTLPPATGDWQGEARWRVGADGSVSVEAPATGLRIVFTPVMDGELQLGWTCEFTPAEHRPSVGRCAGK